MITTFKSGLAAVAIGAMLGLSSFSAEAAPLQSSATEQGAVKQPVAQEETQMQHDRRTTGSIGERGPNNMASPYMMNPKKPLNMDCKLGFNPSSSSSCNY
ncbi:UNVERIFIED_ORG: hypothetical protein GGE64_004323 [Rhizobium etli]|uniref:Uncharacterized protein n=1 Tax=Rhizobium etli bv. mimosae str. IE4771 TaxID=1432050 RepID=A0A060HRY7_RHIET|nr:MULTISPECIES: hypothetical protein [Rhizobium]AIC25648.1 hypothetical protein IE4771_CH00486 [Rhizobium sp. IE4771]AJC77739.1 hypothetical protein IE4803_CH00483 [Rhizobium etli bv. phaseoli str. IE4803]ARQ56589.1 hypothetical protein Kim5_CH00473 [Rhizobium sp. Kim5]RSB92324.1 hypothetical protein EFR00_21590 [Rhizobium sophoriradicis]